MAFIFLELLPVGGYMNGIIEGLLDMATSLIGDVDSEN